MLSKADAKSSKRRSIENCFCESLVSGRAAGPAKVQRCTSAVALWLNWVKR